MNDLIKSQYNVESSLDHSKSPLSTGSDNVAKNPQGYDVIRSFQRQLDLLKVEIRRLHNRNKELHSELARLRGHISK